MVYNYSKNISMGENTDKQGIQAMFVAINTNFVELCKKKYFTRKEKQTILTIPNMLVNSEKIAVTITGQSELNLKA